MRRYFSGHEGPPDTGIIYKHCLQMENRLSEKNKMLDVGAGVSSSLWPLSSWDTKLLSCEMDDVSSLFWKHPKAWFSNIFMHQSEAIWLVVCAQLLPLPLSSSWAWPMLSFL